jgi:hypothetical protein
MVICHTEPKKLLDMMEGYQAPWVEKWLDLQKV